LFHAFFWILAFLPWLPSLAEQFRVSGELRQDLPGWEKVVSIEAMRSVALVAGKFIFGVLDLRFTLFFATGGLLFLLIASFGIGSRVLPQTALLHAFRKAKLKVTQKNTQDLTVILIWLIVPLATAWLVSLVVPILHPKRVLFLLPAF
jgi:hypothetical protein